MVKIIGLKELRQDTEKYIAAAKRGQSFLVMRRSKPIFRVTPPIDEWGDDGIWQTVIDLTQIKKGGISLTELIKKL